MPDPKKQWNVTSEEPIEKKQWNVVSEEPLKKKDEISETSGEDVSPIESPLAGLAKKPNAIVGGTGTFDKSLFRSDGTVKGKGFLGVLPMKDGSNDKATELSIGVDFGKGEMDIPTLVPTLTKEEIDYLLSVNPKEIFEKNPELFKSIETKAVEHAEKRIAEGKSVFADDSDIVESPLAGLAKSTDIAGTPTKGLAEMLIQKLPEPKIPKIDFVKQDEEYKAIQDRIPSIETQEQAVELEQQYLAKNERDKVKLEDELISTYANAKPEEILSLNPEEIIINLRKQGYTKNAAETKVNELITYKLYDTAIKSGADLYLGRYSNLPSNEKDGAVLREAILKSKEMFGAVDEARINLYKQIEKLKSKRDLTPEEFDKLAELDGKYRELSGRSQMYDPDTGMRLNAPDMDVAAEQIISDDYQSLKPLLTDKDKLEKEYMKRFLALTGYNEAIRKLEIETRGKYTPEQRAGAFFGDENQYSEYENKLTNLQQQQKSAELKFNAISRMFLLNENPADYVKDITTAGGLKYWTEKVGKGFVQSILGNETGEMIAKQIGSIPDAEIMSVTEEILNSADIPLTDKQKENLTPSFVEEAVDMGVGLTGVVIKLALLNKLQGVSGLTELFAGLKQGSTINKVQAFIGESLLEGVKFEAIGGEAPTGTGFYITQRLFPNIVIKNPFLNKFINAIYKNNIGMTTAIEGGEAFNSLVKSLENDTPIREELNKSFGDIDEVIRRVLLGLTVNSLFAGQHMLSKTHPINNVKKLTEAKIDILKNKPEADVKFIDNRIDQVKQQTKQKKEIEIAEPVESVEVEKTIKPKEETKTEEQPEALKVVESTTKALEEVSKEKLDEIKSFAPKIEKGQHQIAKDETSSTLDDLTQGSAPSDIYTGMKYYADLKLKTYQESAKVINEVKGKPDAEVTIYRSVPKGINEINSGDWVSLSKTYAKEHGMHHEDSKLDMPVISKKVKVSEVVWDANDLNEFAYFPESKKSETKSISEAYHKAKADGSNPELVKAVEDLLGKQPVADATTKELLKAREDEVKQSISDRLGRLSGIKELIGENEKPGYIKDLGELIKDFVTLGGIKIEQGIDYLKKQLPNLSKFIDDNKDEILKYAKTTEKAMPKTKIQKEIDKTVEGKPEKDKIIIDKYTALKGQLKIEAKSAKIIAKNNAENKKVISDFIKENEAELRKLRGIGITSMMKSINNPKTSVKDIEKVIDRMGKAIERQQEKDAKQEAKKLIKDIATMKTEKTQSGRKVAVKVTSEGVDYLEKVREFIKYDDVKRNNKRDLIEMESEQLRERIENETNPNEKKKLEKELAEKEFEAVVMDKFANLENKTIEEIDEARDVFENKWDEFREEFKQWQKDYNEYHSGVAGRLHDAAYGTEARKTLLAGRGDKAVDPEKVANKMRGFFKMFKSAMGTVSSLSYKLDQSFRSGKEKWDYNKGEFARQVDNLRKGHSKKLVIEYEMKEKLANAIDSEFGNSGKFRRMAKKKHVVELTEIKKDKDGNPIPTVTKQKLKTSALTHIWASYYSEANNPYIKKFGITDAEMAKISEVIPEEMKNFSNWLVYEFIPEYYDIVNEVYKRNTGRDLDKLVDYLHVNAKFWKKQGSGIDLNNVNIFKGFTKTRQYGEYDINKNDILETAMKYIADVSTFSGLAEPIGEYQKALNSKPVSNALIRTGNKPFAEAIIENMHRGYETDFSKSAGGKFLDNKVMNFLRRRFVQTKIRMNPNLLPKQVTSFVAALDGDYGNPLAIMREMATMPLTDMRKITWDIFRSSPQFKYRNITDIESLTKGKIEINPDMFGKSGKPLATALTLLWNPTAVGDKLTIAMAGLPVISAKYKSVMKELSDTELTLEQRKKSASSEALQLFERFMNETQQSGAFTDVSSFQSGGWRNASFFMNSIMAYSRKVSKKSADISRTYVNKKARLIEKGALDNVQTKIKALSGIKLKDINGLFIYTTVLPVLFKTVQMGASNIVKLFSDDEEEKKSAWLEFGYDASIGWTKGLMGLGFMAEYVKSKTLNKYTGDRGDNFIRTLDDSMDLIDDLLDVSKAIFSDEVNADEYNEELKKKGLDFGITSIALATGLPSVEMKRIKQALMDEDYDTLSKKLSRIYGLPKEAIDFWFKKEKPKESAWE